MLMDKIKKLFGNREVPREARDLLLDAKTPKELLRGLDELITCNEMEVNGVNRELEALEELEGREIERVRSGGLPERSKNNVLRRVQRLRKQMDNLEERQRIYNRNINLQIHLVGRTQALDAMEMRGVDDDAIDEILCNYEEELLCYRDTLDTEDLLVSELGSALDDRAELSSLESEILGAEQDAVHEAAVPPESRALPVEDAPLVERQGPDIPDRNLAPPPLPGTRRSALAPQEVER